MFQEGGFFFEAGAQDGERASNTVYLELKRNWTGLLVEVDPWFYSQMRSKMRRAFTANVGISPNEYVSEVSIVFPRQHEISNLVINALRVSLKMETYKHDECESIRH